MLKCLYIPAKIKKNFKHHFKNCFKVIFSTIQLNFDVLVPLSLLSPALNLTPVYVSAPVVHYDTFLNSFLVADIYGVKIQ